MKTQREFLETTQESLRLINAMMKVCDAVFIDGSEILDKNETAELYCKMEETLEDLMCSIGTELTKVLKKEKLSRISINEKQR